MDDISSEGKPRMAVKSRRLVARERTAAIGVIALVIGLPVGLFGFGPSILERYDASHPLAVTCVVHSAEPDIASSRSSKGAGGSEAQVIIHTDCGHILYLEGVERSNMESIASRFEQGERYQFTVGEGTFNLRGALKFLKVAPVADAYQERP